MSYVTMNDLIIKTCEHIGINHYACEHLFNKEGIVTDERSLKIAYLKATNDIKNYSKEKEKYLKEMRKRR